MHAFLQLLLIFRFGLADHIPLDEQSSCQMACCECFVIRPPENLDCIDLVDNNCMYHNLPSLEECADYDKRKELERRQCPQCTR